MKRILTLTTVLFIALGLAADNPNRTITSQHSRIEFETVGEKMVEPNEAIIAIFRDHSDYPVPEVYLTGDMDLRSVPSVVLENIDIILGEEIIDIDDEDDQDEADDLEDEASDLKDSIRSQLRENLVEGEVEYAYMQIGRNIYSTSYDFK